MLEFVTNLMLELVAACSKRVYLTPRSSTKDRLSCNFGVGDAETRDWIASPADSNERVNCIANRLGNAMEMRTKVTFEE